MQHKVVIADYGSGNTRSMYNALCKVRRSDQEILLSNDPVTIWEAERVVLPGVGAFAECRRKLDASGVLPAIQACVQHGKPFLGVCVGMQVLADEGQEFEICPGLGWFPGVTRRIEFAEGYTGPRRLPHVAWSPVEFRPSHLFAGLRPRELFYFVHSFILDCRDRSAVIATANYGENFVAAVQRDNLFACQFHPEKSAEAGLQLLENFCRWQP